MYVSIEGQGHFFTIFFPGFVCFVLYWAKISGEHLQDHWSYGFMISGGCRMCSSSAELAEARPINPAVGKHSSALYIDTLTMAKRLENNGSTCKL